MLISFLLTVLLIYLMFHDLGWISKKVKQVSDDSGSMQMELSEIDIQSLSTREPEMETQSATFDTELTPTWDKTDQVLSCHTRSPDPQLVSGPAEELMQEKRESEEPKPKTRNRRFLEAFTNFRNHVNNDARQEDPVDRINCLILEGNHNFVNRVGNIQIQDLYDNLTKSANLYPNRKERILQDHVTEPDHIEEAAIGYGYADVNYKYHLDREHNGGNVVLKSYR